MSNIVISVTKTTITDLSDATRLTHVCISLHQVAGTLSDGVGIVAFDERHQLVRQEILRDTMGNSRQHLIAGVRGFTHGLMGGLTSIVTQTYNGTMDRGIEVSEGHMMSYGQAG